MWHCWPQGRPGHDSSLPMLPPRQQTQAWLCLHHLPTRTGAGGWGCSLLASSPKGKRGWKERVTTKGFPWAPDGADRAGWGTRAGSCRGSDAASLSNSSSTPPPPTPHTRTHTRAVRGSLQAPGRKAGCLWRSRAPTFPHTRQPGAAIWRAGAQARFAAPGSPSTCRSPGGWGGPLGKVCGAPAHYRQPTLSKNQLPENKAGRDQGVEVGLPVTRCSFRQTPATTRRGHAPEGTAPSGSNRNSKSEQGLCCGDQSTPHPNLLQAPPLPP